MDDDIGFHIFEALYAIFKKRPFYVFAGSAIAILFFIGDMFFQAYPYDLVFHIFILVFFLVVVAGQIVKEFRRLCNQDY